VAFKPDEALNPSAKHRFRLEIPLEEHALVPPEEKELPPEPFPGKPFAFEFEIPMRPVPVIEAGQKETVSGVTLTLDRVIDSPVVKRAVFCYEAPDDEHRWFLEGGKGITPTAGMSSNPSMKSVPPPGARSSCCGPPGGPLLGRSAEAHRRSGLSFRQRRVCQGVQREDRSQDDPWPLEVRVRCADHLARLPATTGGLSQLGSMQV